MPIQKLSLKMTVTVGAETDEKLIHNIYSVSIPFIDTSYYDGPFCFPHELLMSFKSHRLDKKFGLLFLSPSKHF